MDIFFFLFLVTIYNLARDGEDIDECEAGQLCGPFSNCHNTNGSFYCTCQRDFSPSAGPAHFQPDNGTHCRGTRDNDVYTLAL